MYGTGGAVGLFVTATLIGLGETAAKQGKEGFHHAR